MVRLFTKVEGTLVLHNGMILITFYFSETWKAVLVS